MEAKLSLPLGYLVEQRFERPVVADIPAAVRSELEADLRHTQLADYFQPLEERALVASSVAQLSEQGFAPKPDSAAGPYVALLTALEGRARAGSQAGWTAWQLSDREIPGERRLPFGEVRRMAEEALFSSYSTRYWCPIWGRKSLWYSSSISSSVDSNRT